MDIRERIDLIQRKLSNKRNNLKTIDDILTSIDGIIIFNNYIINSAEALKRISDSSEEINKIETILENSQYINSNTKDIIQYIKDGIERGNI